MSHIKGWRVALVTTAACAFLVAATYPGAAEAQAAKPAVTKATAKPAQRGMTWESIKALPDWSGMWAPGRRPDIPGLPPGSGAFGSPVPYKPDIKARVDARRIRVGGNTSAGVADIPLSNSGFCLPAGVPSNMGLVSHEYMFRPGMVMLVLENSEVRRIYTDGRGHPPDDESNPDFQGHSIGHWEGDTLVVETAQIFPEAEISFGNTVTEKSVVRERIHLADKNTLQIDTEMTDPDLFTGPWVYTRYFRREVREAVPYEACTMEDRAQKIGDKLVDIDFNPNRPKLAPGEAVIPPSAKVVGDKAVDQIQTTVAPGATAPLAATGKKAPAKK